MSPRGIRLPPELKDTVAGALGVSQSDGPFLARPAAREAYLAALADAGRKLPHIRPQGGNGSRSSRDVGCRATVESAG